MPARSSSARRVDELFRFPQHPYTVGLLGALPRLDRRRPRLAAIEGTVPNMTAPPEGCRFQARCPFRIPQCAEMPPLAAVEPAATSRAAGARRWRGSWRDPNAALSPLDSTSLPSGEGRGGVSRASGFLLRARTPAAQKGAGAPYPVPLGLWPSWPSPEGREA